MENNIQLESNRLNLKEEEIENYPLVKKFCDDRNTFSHTILEHLEPYDLDKISPFTKELHWSSNASVELSKIIGTQHPDYANSSWFSLKNYLIFITIHP
jgi:hypothetical protein